MTPYDVIKHNRSVLHDTIGDGSYTVTVDFKKDPSGSIGGMAAAINNDVKNVMEDEPYNNARKYFHCINVALSNVSFKLGKGHEDFNEVLTRAREWCENHRSDSDINCPHRFYFTVYSKQNRRWIDRLVSRMQMFIKPHRFVIHVVRDGTLDSYCGGYFIQMHIYSKRPSDWLWDDKDAADKEAEFISMCRDELNEMLKPCKMMYVLTNPSIFGRVKHWLRRCYARYNSFCYMTYEHLKHAIKFEILTTK